MSAAGIISLKIWASFNQFANKGNEEFCLLFAASALNRFMGSDFFNQPIQTFGTLFPTVSGYLVWQSALCAASLVFKAPAIDKLP